MEQQYNGLQIPQNNAISWKSRNPQIAVTIRLMSLRSAVILIANFKERCQQFDIATAICELSANIFGPDNMPHLGHQDVDDGDGLSKDPNDKSEGCTSHPITTTARLLQHLRTVAPVSGTIQRNGDYLSLQVLSNGAFTPLHPFRLGWSYMAKQLFT